MIEFWTWLAIGVAVLVAIGWYLSYTAARLDRLHTRQYGSLASLDAHLVRRAEAALSLATSPAIDPASAVLLVTAASDVLEAPDAWTPQREEIETALTRVLQVALTEQEAAAARVHHDEEHPQDPSAAPRRREGTPMPRPVPPHAEQVDQPCPAHDPGTLEAIERLRQAAAQARLARRFHNEAVSDVVAVRSRGIVRLFHLAGHEPMPRAVVFDDDIPALAGGDVERSVADRVSRM